MGKILIVDDEKEICEILAENLEELGHFVMTAHSGRMALEVLNNHDFDLIISDIRMKDGDGLFLMEEISKRNITNLPLFIFVTGYIDKDLLKLHTNKVRAIHQKPLDFDAFLDDVFDCFSQKH